MDILKKVNFNFGNETLEKKCRKIFDENTVYDVVRFNASGYIPTDMNFGTEKEYTLANYNSSTFSDFDNEYCDKDYVVFLILGGGFNYGNQTSTIIVTEKEDTLIDSRYSDVSDFETFAYTEVRNRLCTSVSIKRLELDSNKEIPFESFDMSKSDDSYLNYYDVGNEDKSLFEIFDVCDDNDDKIQYIIDKSKGDIIMSNKTDKMIFSFYERFSVYDSRNLFENKKYALNHLKCSSCSRYSIDEDKVEKDANILIEKCLKADKTLKRKTVESDFYYMLDFVDKDYLNGIFDDAWVEFIVKYSKYVDETSLSTIGFVDNVRFNDMIKCYLRVM